MTPLTATEADNDELVLSVEPQTPVAFGDVNVGTVKELDAFTVTNNGSSQLVGVVATQRSFSIVSGGTYDLAPGRSQVVRISFQPTAVGPTTEIVTFTFAGGVWAA